MIFINAFFFIDSVCVGNEHTIIKWLKAHLLLTGLLILNVGLQAGLTPPVTQRLTAAI